MFQVEKEIKSHDMWARDLALISKNSENIYQSITQKMNMLFLSQSTSFVIILTFVHSLFYKNIYLSIFLLAFFIISLLPIIKIRSTVNVETFQSAKIIREENDV